MEKNVKIYKSVFNRENHSRFTFDDFVFNHEQICVSFGMHDMQKTGRQLRDTTDKRERNDLKRNYLPAADLSGANVFSIDIDDISENPTLKAKIVNTLLNDDKDVMLVTESISGNIVAYYRFDIEPSLFSKLYYKKYLELTLKLGVNIDFLPEINRLRYLAVGGSVYYYNPDAKPLTEYINISKVPYIKVEPDTKKGGKRVVFKSN